MEYFRPQVDKKLQRPLLILSVRLDRRISDVASEAIRQYLEAYLEGLIDEPEPSHQNPSIVGSKTLRFALEQVRKHDGQRHTTNR